MADFLSETIKARGQYNNIFYVLKENSKHKILYTEKIFLKWYTGGQTVRCIIGSP